MKSAKGGGNASTSSRVHLTDVVDDLAQDMMETMLVSGESDDDYTNEAVAQEGLMARLEEGAAKEASVNHSVRFDLPNTQIWMVIWMPVHRHRRIFATGLDFPTSPETLAQITS